MNLPRNFFFGLLLTTGLSAFSTEPAGNYNLPIQSRTRSCTPMRGSKVQLRFADGTPTGYYVNANDPSKQGGRAPCPIGSMEIDAHEALTNANGMVLYFHPGGGGSHYENAVENGQYGHIAADDLKSLPVIKPNGNGKPAPLLRNGSGTMDYLIAPTLIPRDMYYKPNVQNGHSGSTYLTYGNPGFDKTGGHGDWTYINWSWVHNGGAQYPKNICRGGGMVRALGRRGDLFTACDVEPIVGYSYGKDNQINGRVTAFYGKTTAGKGGSAIYGWLPHSYQKLDDIIVPCIRRAAQRFVPNQTGNGESAPTITRKSDRMERMALNLASTIHLTPEKAQATRAKWLVEYNAEKDLAARMELITELARLDDLETVHTLAAALAKESEPGVREQIIVVLAFMGPVEAESKIISAALVENYRRSKDQRERSRTEEIAAHFPGEGEMLRKSLRAE
jgi:hypothetical protein